MRVVSIELPKELDEQLTEIARRRNVPRSTVLREALELFAHGSPRSVTQAVGDLVGSVRGPGDLATNPKRMTGYGE